MQKHGTNLKLNENGSIKSSIEYDTGVKNGKMLLYHQNGLLKTSYSYINNILNGEFNEHFPTG